MAISSTSSDDDAVVIDRDDISNYNPEHILPEAPDEVAKIRKWLQATDYAHQSGEFRKHLASHMIGTGSWLTSSDVYRTWVESADNGMFWIKGIPGSGKSVVAAHLIDKLKSEHPGAPILYFFFRQIIDANHEPAALLRDWLDQVLEYSPPLQKKLKELLEARRSLTSLSMEDLIGYLRLAFASLPGKVFCVADALDEMDSGNDEFLQSLATLGSWRPGKVKILITSRPVSSVEGPLRKAELLTIRLDEAMVDTDIASYVERGLRTTQLSVEEQHQIRKAVPGRANGIFLYAKLAMDAFLEPGLQVAEVLRTLPADLHEMYTSLLREHATRSGVPQDIQLLILQWVTHATRPLRLLELAEMISATYQPPGRSSAVHDLSSSKKLVRAAAGPLLEILPNETVCVIHHSFTEYLKCMTRSETDGGYPILLPGPTHGRLALACLSYLQAGCLNSVTTSDDGDSKALDSSEEDDYYPRQEKLGHDAQRIRLQYPFFAYATANWQMHITRSSAVGFDQSNINSTLDQFLSNRQHTKAWLKLQWGGNIKSCIGITPLHIAARFGLTEFARGLIEKGADIHAADYYGKTPLWWAATEGHAAIIELLVQAGAKPDQEDRVQGLKPLHEAAQENYAEAVRTLLEAGVNPLTPKTHESPGRRCGNAPTTRGHTPLMYACHNGHLEALEAFLPFLSDADTVNRALAWSAVRGRSKLVTSILQHPEVRVNGKVNGDTPLYLACKSGDRDTIVVLLEHGADPCILSCDYGDEFGGIGSRRSSFYGAAKKKEPSGYSALHALCANGSRRYRRDAEDHEHLQELFTLLVNAKVDVNQRWEGGCTALHAAANNPVLVRLLLRAGADANAVDGPGRTPLHLAISPESISLLVEEGQADINKVYPYDGRTPLLCMLDKYHSEPIVKLLEYRPDLTIKDKKGNGPLHVALARWSNDTSIIKELLNAGANPNERNRAGETPLLMMRIDNRASAEMIDLLLTSGADINATDSSGKTILSRNMGGQMPSSNSSGSDVAGLIERGADIHVRDFKGRTLLHCGVAQHAGNRGAWYGVGEQPATCFDHMLELGLDVQALDYQGNTLIHELATKSGMLDSYSGPQYIPLLNQLISLGVDINQGNQQGRTALHMLTAASSSNGTASYKSDHYGPLDLILSKVNDVDQKDIQGLTALHLASTVSEYTTKKLLDAGGNPTLASHEGLTPLHLAARARQSNIVGLLLAANEAFGHTAMDSEDEKGNTPLYYACRSGRPESVKLLLDAGADASNKTMLLACAAFEEEHKLWDGERHPAETERNQNAGGLTLDDKTRPNLPSSSNWRLGGFDDARDSPRLEEIVDLLIAHGCDTADVVGAGSYWGVTGPLNIAANAGHRYAFKCLLRARDHWTDNQDTPSTTQTLLEEGEIRAYMDADVAVATNPAHFVDGQANSDLIMRALKRRQYHVMRPVCESGVDFLQEKQDRSNLTVFAHLGYATLLKEIGVVETERKLGDGRWHAFADPTKPGLYINVMPSEQSISDTEQPILLLTALERALPNMEVVRLLVEEFHVDVNQRRLKNTYVDGGYKTMPQETALLYLAKGLHWWHTALAMPYLISKGAEIESKDYNGLTSLHIAASIDQYVGPFHKESARVLVAAGADVNTTDNKGRSCLASAVGNDDIFHLLIDHGASIRPDALFMAINAKRADIVERLLKAGADPNMRLEADPATSSSQHNRRASSRRVGDLPPHEVYPLFAAAKQHSVGFRPRSAKEERESSRQAVQMVEALLAAGADPYATFTLEIPERLVEKAQDSQGEDIREVRPEGRSSTEKFEQVMLLHDLLDQNELVHPILTHAKLDASRRDARGRSVLHMVCHSYCLTAPIDSLFAASTGFESSMPSFLELLLARGADPVATDNKGRNILHHIFEKPRQMSKDRDLPSIVQLARDYPSLLNQADAQGNTPLHLAMKHAIYQSDVAPAQTLLDAGADASAVDNNGNGCLHLLALCIYNSASIRNLFTVLIRRGLDINMRNNRGESPIFNLNRSAPDNTARKPSENKILNAAEAVSFFEQLDADFFARDKQGRGLLHIAAKEIVEVNKDDARRFRYQDDKEQESPIARFQVLLAKGLDPMMEDEKKRTCLDVAAACGKESVLELFQKDGPGAKDSGAGKEEEGSEGSVIF